MKKHIPKVIHFLLHVTFTVIVAIAMYIISFGLSTKSVATCLAIAAYFCVFAIIPIAFAIYRSIENKGRHLIIPILLAVLSVILFILNGRFYQSGMDKYPFGYDAFNEEVCTVMPTTEQISDAENSEYVYWNRNSTKEEYMSIELSYSDKQFGEFIDDLKNLEHILVKEREIGGYNCRLFMFSDWLYAGAVGYNENTHCVVYVFFTSSDLSSIDAWDIIEAEFDYCFDD